MNDEFLISNNLGAYASSTFHAGNTRKYHGLLVAASPNIERKVIVNTLEEKITIENQEFFLNTAKYADGTVYPDNSKYVKSFSIAHPVRIEFEINEVKISKEIHIDEYANSVEVTYKFKSEKPFDFEITPLLTDRIFHDLKRADDLKKISIKPKSGWCVIKLAEGENLIVKAHGLEFNPQFDVYQNVFYGLEKERGYDAVEDLAKVGIFRQHIPQGTYEIKIRFEYKNENFKFENLPSSRPEFEIKKEDYDPILGKTDEGELSEFGRFLQIRANDFVVHNGYRNSIVAGYHWFEDWGRDTFVSLRGILLTRNLVDIAKSILIHWSKYIKNGLVPNRPGLLEYNSIDASLWFVVATYHYYQHTKDEATFRYLFPFVAEIIQNFVQGTDYGIRMLPNGLVYADNQNKALTWMDAQIDGKPVTDRSGAAVEIQMLWYNTLEIYKLMDEKFNDAKSVYYVNFVINNLKKSFNEIFWNESLNFVYDTMGIYDSNAQIRPNVIIGMSLPFQLLGVRKSLLVLQKTESELLTTLGLKTLNLADPNYRPDYEGNQYERDMAYHNGTIWPYLLGLYGKSYLNIYGKDKDSIKYIKKILLDFWREIKQKDLNYIPEVFGAESQNPGGCLTQAWNYATLLELFFEIHN